MATAALQRVATRLGGRALRAEVQFPRAGGSGSAKGPRVDVGKEEQIKSLKEDFYTTFARWERNKLVDGTLARQNGQLLEQLAVQIEPRPNDPLCYLALGGVFDFFKGPDPKERKEQN